MVIALNIFFLFKNLLFLFLFYHKYVLFFCLFCLIFEACAPGDSLGKIQKNNIP